LERFKRPRHLSQFKPKPFKPFEPKPFKLFRMFCEDYW